MNSFYVTLLSDGSMETFPENTQCCFRTNLPKPIQIDKEEWEVALVEIIHPIQAHNITVAESNFRVILNDDKMCMKVGKTSLNHTKSKGIATVPLSFPPGSYSNGAHLLETINNIIQDALGEIFKEFKVTAAITYSKHQGRAKFSSNSATKVGLRFEETLLQKLGSKPDTVVIFPNRNEKYFPYPLDLDMEFNQIFIYSDIADYTFLGDIEAPILRVLPFKMNAFAVQQHSHKEFQNLHYVPVAKSYFDQILINITGNTGENIQFSHGKCVVRLHFRQRSKLHF